MTQDGFENGNYHTDPTWNEVITVGTVGVTEASKKNGTYGLEMTACDGAGVELHVTGLSLATLDTWCWVKVSDAAIATANYAFLQADTDHIATFWIWSDVFKYRDSGGVQSMSVETPKDNTWYALRIKYDGTLVSYYVYSDSYELLDSAEDRTAANTGNVGIVSLAANNAVASGDTIYFDDVGYSDDDPPEAPAVGQYLATKKYW